MSWYDNLIIHEDCVSYHKEAVTSVPVISNFGIYITAVLLLENPLE